MVPIALGVNALRLVQEKLHFLAGQDLGQLTLHLVRDHASGRKPARMDHIGVKRLQGGHCAGDGGDRLALADEVLDVALHIALRYVVQRTFLPLQVGRKLPNVP